MRLIEVHRIVKDAERRHPRWGDPSGLRFVRAVRDAGVSSREFALERGLSLAAWLLACVAIGWTFKAACDWLVD